MTFGYISYSVRFWLQDGKSISIRIQLCTKDVDSAIGIYCSADVQSGQQKAEEKGQSFHHQADEWCNGKWVSWIIFSIF